MLTKRIVGLPRWQDPALHPGPLDRRPVDDQEHAAPAVAVGASHREEQRWLLPSSCVSSRTGQGARIQAAAEQLLDAVPVTAAADPQDGSREPAAVPVWQQQGRRTKTENKKIPFWRRWVSSRATNGSTSRHNHCHVSGRRFCRDFQQDVTSVVTYTGAQLAYLVLDHAARCQASIASNLRRLLGWKGGEVPLLQEVFPHKSSKYIW